MLILNDSNCLYRQEPGKKVFSWSPTYLRDSSAAPLVLSHPALLLLIVLIDFPFVALKPFSKDVHQGRFPKFPLLPPPHLVSQSLDFKN